MKFERTGPFIEMKEYFEGNKEEILRALDNEFRGWVFMENKEDKSICNIFYIKKYETIDMNRISFLYSKMSVNIVKMDDIDNHIDIKIMEDEEYLEIFKDDIIYSLKEYSEDEKEPVIKWWRKGKFESMKTFEQFNEGIKWYSKGKFENDQDSDINIPEYDDFIPDDEFREFLIDNGVYDAYIENSLDPRFKSGMTSVDFPKGIEKIYRNNYILSAFNWKLSPEGDNFWSDLSEKWQKLVRKK